MNIPRGWRRLCASTLFATLAITMIVLGSLSTSVRTGHAAPISTSGPQHSAPPAGSQPVMSGLWDAQNYEMPHHAASCAQPPADATTRLALSDAQLAAVGLPTHAQIPDLATWQAQIRAARKHDCDYVVDVVKGKPVTNSVFTSNVWGGWLTEGSGSYGYIDDATTYFNVPCTDGSYATQASEWVGVGGAFSSHPLVQAGVEEIVTYGNVAYKAFYEYVPQGGSGQGARALNWNVHCTDVMYVYTKTNGYTYIADNTQGLYSANTWGFASSDSAEWIVERLSVGSGCPGTLGCQPLSNYHAIGFGNSWFMDTSGYSHAPTDFPTDLYDLYSGSWLLESASNWTVTNGTGYYRMDWLHGS